MSLPAPASTLTDTETLSSTVTEQTPIAWQIINERDVAVPVRYAISPDGSVSFVFGSYDPTVPLTIDPTLTYSTYLGGSGGDSGYSVAVDSAGNTYLTGVTGSSNFPLANPQQGSYAGTSDAFVTKLNATGTELIYSTYLGGSGADYGAALAVDSSGNAYLTGAAGAGFPVTTGAYDTTANGNGDGFIAKLNAAGNSLVYSTYLGGSARIAPQISPSIAPATPTLLRRPIPPIFPPRTRCNQPLPAQQTVMPSSPN